MAVALSSSTTGTAQAADHERRDQAMTVRIASIWPILVVTAAGLLLIGCVMAFLTRYAMERQMLGWVQTSLRSAATARVLLVQRQMQTTREFADQVASRILVREQLDRYQKGTVALADLQRLCSADLAPVLTDKQGIVGVAVLDREGKRLAAVGRVPAEQADSGAVSREPQDVAVTLAGDFPVLRAAVSVRNLEGSVIGNELVFCRMDGVAAIYLDDLGFGPGLVRRLAARIDGRPTWVIPEVRAATQGEAAELEAAFARPTAEVRMTYHPDGTIAGVRAGIPDAGMVVCLDLDPATLESYRDRHASLVTAVLLALVAVGTVGVLLAVLPIARGMVRQTSRLDRTMVELQRSEAFNRRIAASSPDGILVLDRNGGVVTVTGGGLKMLERTDVSSLLGLPWMSIWPEDSPARPLAAQALQTALGKGVGRFQAGWTGDGGPAIWWDVVVAPILGAHGEVDRLLAVFRDISDRRRAERAVEASERRLRMVAAATNDAIWDWDLATGAIWWNDGVCAMFGYERREIGSHADWWRAQLHPQDHARITAAIGQLIAGSETVWRAEYRFRNADGSYTPVLDRGQVIRDAGGAALRLVSAMFDLTERKQLVESEHRRNRMASLRADVSAALVTTVAARSLLQTCAEALVRHLDAALARIWLLDPADDALVLEASAGLYTHLDGDHGRIPAGQAGIGAIATERRPHLTNAVIGDAFLPDQEWVRREGLVAFAGYPLIVGGAVIGVMALFSRHPFEQDTFDGLSVVADLMAQGLRRRTIEQELAEKAMALRRTNVELEQFTYVASHDLQEPLRTIANLLDLLDRRYHQVLDDKARRYIGHSVEAASRLQLLIKGLLAYSKAGFQGAAGAEAVSSVEVFAEVVEDLQATIAESGATVSADGLPEIRYNRIQLGQLFQNLLSNALKYRGQDPPRVQLSARREAGRWVFSCRDNGIGIEPRYFERIFEVFQRLHAREMYQGTGIGLALCRKIVVSHGGTIWVESAPGTGSTFHFTVPDQPPPSSVAPSDSGAKVRP